MMKVLPDANSKLEEYLPFRQVDFIVSDIDGTLISGENNVLMQIKRMIRTLRQQKIHLTIATGRTFYGAKKMLEELEIKTGMPVALYNGGIVIEYGTENLLYAKFIEPDVIVEMINELSLESTNIFIYTFGINRDCILVSDNGTIVEKVYGIGKRDKVYDVNGLKIEWIGSPKELETRVVSILIEKSSMSITEGKKIIDFLDKIQGVSFTDSGNGFIEIKAEGLDKGIIFPILKNQKKYSLNNILAIGDNDNDKELFQYADISVAVANSSAIAIFEADYVCKNESANGFLDMLNVVKTAKKYCTDWEFK